ncbi:MFS transporter [Candidatus Bathyarchaeota archaeon]|nr:MFS transporter [Candidatus Bathyarchaeota archaeon]
MEDEGENSLQLLNRNISAIVIGEFISSMGWTIFYVLWQPYVLSLGASMTALGLLRGIRIGVTSTLQLLTGRLSDVLGRKRPMLMAYLLGIASIALIVAASNWPQLLPAVLLLSLSEALWVPAAYSIVAESVETGERGRAYSYLSESWFLPGLIFSAAAGLLADRVGMRPLLATIILTDAVSLSIVWLYVSETHRGGSLNPGELLRDIGNLIRPRGILSRLYIVGMVDSLSSTMVEGILLGMLMRSYGLSLTQLGLLMNVLCAATVVTQIPMGRLIDRYGCRPFLLSSTLLWLTSLSGYLFFRGFCVYLLLHALWGVSLAMWIPAFNAYLSDIVGEDERGRAFGDLNALMGLISLPAPIIGGLLYDHLGFNGPISASLSLAVLTLLAILTLREGGFDE